MAIRIRPESAAPIYEQIVDQIIFAVANEDIAPGSMIPSVRDLSVQLTINPNTVVRAYQELENRGIISPLRGRGMVVTPEAMKLCQHQRKELIRETVRNTIREAISAGLTLEELTKLISQSWPSNQNGAM